MQTLQQYLEEERDKYFVNIEEHAVKVPSITHLKVANLTWSYAVGILNWARIILNKVCDSYLKICS